MSSAASSARPFAPQRLAAGAQGDDVLASVECFGEPAALGAHDGQVRRTVLLVEREREHAVGGAAGDVAGLLGLFERLREKAQDRTGRDYGIVSIQEAGLDGYWLHRVLAAEGVESHVVDAASVAVSRPISDATVSRKFILGLPMNPATNRLRGWW